MDVKEHQEKMKENIKKLENTTLFDRSRLKDIHLFFFLCHQSKTRNL